MPIYLFIVLSVLLLLGALTLWRAYRVEPHHPRLSVHRIPVPMWDPKDRFKIVQLSDLHLWGLTELHTRVLRYVAEAEPDLIVLTGDYAESGEGLRALGELLGRLGSVAPVYAVMGDNDQENPEWQERLETVFEYAGVTTLHNGATLLKVQSGWLIVAGTDDPNSGHCRVAEVRAQVEGQLRAAKAELDDAGVFSVVLAHSPEIVVEAQPWMNLILTGHTHGGQICLPGGKALYTNTPACKGYASGMYRIAHGARMYVHRGVGTARLPLRLFCPPEVALFELGGTAGDEY